MVRPARRSTHDRGPALPRLVVVADDRRAVPGRRRPVHLADVVAGLVVAQRRELLVGRGECPEVVDARCRARRPARAAAGRAGGCGAARSRRSSTASSSAFRPQPERVGGHGRHRADGQHAAAVGRAAGSRIDRVSPVGSGASRRRARCPSPTGSVERAAPGWRAVPRLRMRSSTRQSPPAGTRRGRTSRPTSRRISIQRTEMAATTTTARHDRGQDEELRQAEQPPDHERDQAAIAPAPTTQLRVELHGPTPGRRVTAPASRAGPASRAVTSVRARRPP